MATWEKLFYEKLNSAPASDHNYSGITIDLTCNSAVAFGDLCKVNSSSQAVLAKADAVANSFGLFMALETVTGGEIPHTAKFLIPGGIARDDTWDWTPGGAIYLSTTGTTGNTLTQTAPSGSSNVIQIVGIALTADVMFFYPQLAQVVHV